MYHPTIHPHISPFLHRERVGEVSMREMRSSPGMKGRIGEMEPSPIRPLYGAHVELFVPPAHARWGRSPKKDEFPDTNLSGRGGHQATCRRDKQLQQLEFYKKPSGNFILKQICAIYFKTDFLASRNGLISSSEIPAACPTQWLHRDGTCSHRTCKSPSSLDAQWTGL